MLHCLVPAHTLLQAGIVAQGGLLPLLDLLETCQSNLQVRGGRGVHSMRGRRLCLSAPHAARTAARISIASVLPIPFAAQRGFRSVRPERQRGQPAGVCAGGGGAGATAWVQGKKALGVMEMAWNASACTQLCWYTTLGDLLVWRLPCHPQALTSIRCPAIAPLQRINECELVVQASKDCVNKLMKRLQVGRVGKAGVCLAATAAGMIATHHSTS